MPTSLLLCGPRCFCRPFECPPICQIEEEVGSCSIQWHFDARATKGSSSLLDAKRGHLRKNKGGKILKRGAGAEFLFLPLLKWRADLVYGCCHRRKKAVNGAGGEVSTPFEC